MVPLNQQDKLVSEFKGRGFEIDSTQYSIVSGEKEKKVAAIHESLSSY
jgi:hypothetical protein